MTPATVYVIDDDASVRRAFERLLRAAGYRVVPCASATDFLELTDVTRPLCLLADVRMPGKTGFDLQEALRAAGRELPIVFITGHGDDAMAARAQALGAVALLSKPVDDVALFEAIRIGVERDRQAIRAGAASRSKEE